MIQLEECPLEDALGEQIEHYLNVRDALPNIEELANNISVNGLLVPLLVCKQPNRAGWYWTIDGNRRLAALRLLKIQKATVRVCPRVPTPLELQTLQGCLALHCASLTPWEISKLFSEYLVANLGAKQSDVAKTYSKDDGFVSRHLAFLRGTAKVQEAYRLNRISAKLTADIVQWAKDEQDAILEAHSNGATLSDISTARLKRRTAGNVTRSQSFVFELADARVSVSSDESDLANVEQVVAQLLKQVRKAIAEGITDPKVFSAVMKQKAKVAT